jgi:hypothetical protein
MLGSEVVDFNFLVEIITLLIPKFPEAHFAEIWQRGQYLLMRSKGEPGFPFALVRNVVNRRIRHRRKRKSASARRGCPGFLVGCQEAANCNLRAVKPHADLDGSESVHVIVEDLDLVALAEEPGSSRLELVNG